LLNNFATVYIVNNFCFSSEVILVLRFRMDFVLDLLSFGCCCPWCQIIVYNANHYDSSLTRIGRNL